MACSEIRMTYFRVAQEIMFKTNLIIYSLFKMLDGFTVGCTYSLAIVACVFSHPVYVLQLARLAV